MDRKCAWPYIIPILYTVEVCHPCWSGVCCTDIPEPTCTAANGVCHAARKPLDTALKGALKALDASKNILDAAKGVLTGAQHTVDGAKAGLDGAILALEGVKQAYNVGFHAMGALFDFTVPTIINIREMYFKVGLNVASGGKFQCRVIGVIMGHNINVNLDFDIHNIQTIAKRLAEYGVSGISKYFG